MKLLPLLLAVGSLGLAGCNSVTSQSAIAVAQPLVSDSLKLVLQNNPRYIPIAQTVGADLVKANWADLSITGINALITAAVVKEGGTPDLAAIIADGLDAGLAGYLANVVESSLASDPNAALVLQALGQAVVTGAAGAAANPKT